MSFAIAVPLCVLPTLTSVVEQRRRSNTHPVVYDRIVWGGR